MGRAREVVKQANAARDRLGGTKVRWALMLLLLCLITAATTVHAAPRSPGVQEGIAAYKSGAFAIALQRFEPLTKAGNPEAAYWMGRMYQDGLGVKKDVDKAVTYFKQAAKKGWRDADLRLGEIYFHGTDVIQNFALARKWLERAAYSGDPLAQRDVGKLYAEGWGVQKDPVWAYVWYEIASRLGDHEASRLRDSLLETMQSSQVAEAQKLVQKIAPEVLGLAHDESNGSQPARAAGPSGAGSTAGHEGQGAT
jgi:TPR repeat protein